MTDAAGNPSFPYFDQVSDKIAVYMKRGGIDDFSAAYRMACQATPQIAVLIGQKANLKRRREAEEARRAAMSSISNSIPLSSADLETPNRTRGGRPRELDWDGAMIEVIRIADINGLPPTQADLCKQIGDWFVKEVDREPAESELKKFASKIYNGLRQRGWEPKGS